MHQLKKRPLLTTDSMLKVKKAKIGISERQHPANAVYVLTWEPASWIWPEPPQAQCWAADYLHRWSLIPCPWQPPHHAASRSMEAYFRELIWTQPRALFYGYLFLLSTVSLSIWLCCELLAILKTGFSSRWLDTETSRVTLKFWVPMSHTSNTVHSQAHSQST